MAFTPSVRFALELKRQLKYLDTSCREFDNGNTDEGIRIGIVLRVLFHNTSHSQSLLSHLGRNGIRMLSTAHLKTAYTIGSLTNVQIDFSPPLSVRITPKLDKCTKNFVPFEHWWTGEAVFERGGTVIYRKDLVLWAVNKDGGAHVDATLPPKYQELLDGEWISIGHERQGQMLQRATAQSAAVSALRQMAFETLNTPDLDEKDTSP